jgi:hypothetical protein
LHESYCQSIDKTGVADFVKELPALGFEVFSTAALKIINEAGVLSMGFSDSPGSGNFRRQGKDAASGGAGGSWQNAPRITYERA